MPDGAVSAESLREHSFDVSGRAVSPWIARVFATADSLDADALIELYTDDARAQVGNAPAAEGKAAVLEAFRGLFGSIRGMRHRFTQTWDVGDVAIVEADVEYVRPGGEPVTMPCVTILRREGDLIRDDRIYIDLAPLQAER